uniref:ATPase inhibitor, mitochondrial-like n=1 Tax=Jaculus jaculus TaxID=51337 RepID=UPI001E1B5074|nr:ATPase inhibitor, mitochondrial-like [Jaculus jaculus]
MAGTLALQLRLGVWGVRAMQTRGFASDPTESHDADAGSIQEAGGALAKREKAEEDRYFQEKTKEQLAALKKHHLEEIQEHEEEIQHLQKQIERHKKQLKHLNQDD